MTEHAPPQAPNPEVAVLLDELIASARPSSRTLPLPEGRQNFRELIAPYADRPEVGPVTDRMIPADGHEVPVRLYRPAGESLPGIVVFLHGGGWVFGDLDSHDGLCRSLTRGSGITTVAVDYRCAPEHPFPAGLEDAVVVIRDEGGSPVRFQALLYPATDPSMSSASYRQYGDDPFLSADEMAWYWAQYGGGGIPADPRAALSTLTDLRGLPPAYVLVAGLDPLRDDGLAFAEALRTAGVPVYRREYPDMPHGFLLFPARLSAAAQALSEVAGAIAGGLSGQV